MSSMSANPVNCSISISHGSSASATNPYFNLTISGEVDPAKLQNEIQRIKNLFCQYPESSDSFSESPKQNASDFTFGERNGTDYTVKSSVVVHSFEDFVHELEPGILRVICKNQPIKTWKGIEKFPHSVTQLFVEGCEFENFEGEIANSNIMELRIDSCRLSSFKGIHKTKLTELTCTNNPCYSEWKELIVYSFNCASVILSILKERYAKMQQ